MTHAPATAAGRVPRELRPWVGEGERIAIDIRSSPWAVLIESLGTLTLIALLLALIGAVLAAYGVLGPYGDELLLSGAVAGAARLAWQGVVVACRRYVLTRRYVLRVAGVFSRSAASLPIGRVQHVLVHRTLPERLTGTGTLGFATAGTAGVEVLWLVVSQPMRRAEEVRRVLEELAQGAPAGAPAVIGLAGGVGAGKSSVARAFESLGCVVADSDKAAREALDRPDVRARLVEWWGGGILDEAGRVDRTRVASIVFQDENERLRLEGLVHPIVRESRAELIERARKAGSPAVIVDAPLLFEAGLNSECDAVVFVEAPRHTRLERVRVSRGWDEAELDQREKVQLPLDEKRERSDYVLVNDAGADRLTAEARRILDQILARRRGSGSGSPGPDAG